MQSPTPSPTPYGFAPWQNGPPSHYPPPSNCGYPPYQSWAYPTPYNPFPGSVFNSGGNVNGSGRQENGDVKVNNSKSKSGGVDISKIGGNHDNTNGQQIAGDTVVGNIASA